MKLLAIAGELSGDTHGGALLSGLRLNLPGLDVEGIGGPRMLSQGLRALYPLSDLQVHGLFEVLTHLPRLYRMLWALERRLDEHRPDALLLIDYPGFNLKLAAAAKKRGIPVYYYCSPQVWAWRRGRIRTIARVVDLMIVLFPFEATLYQEAGLASVFLGHPLVDVVASEDEVAHFQAQIVHEAIEDRERGGEEPGGKPVVSLMPGSRPSELRRHLETLLEAVALIEAEGFQARWVLPVAPGLDREAIEAEIQRFGVPVRAMDDAFLPLLRTADLAMVASGTATLQTAMAGIPFLVFYRVAPLTYALARRFAYLPFISIVNILAGREVVPELLQEAMTPESLRDAFLALALDPDRQAGMREELSAITAQLGEPGAYDRAAALLAKRISGTTDA